MRTISIAIKTKDEEYADALAMALARNIKGLDIDVPGGDPAGYDVVLTDAAYSADGHMSCSNGNAIFLTDSLDEDENHVYRYGNVMRIAEAVIKSSNVAEDALRADNDTDIFVFVSPQGGSGCSTCSVGFAEALTLTKGKRTLLLSMAPLGLGSKADGSDEAGSTLRANDIRALLYHIADGKDMGSRIGSFLEESARGVRCFREYSGISPLSEISPDLMENFLSVVIKSGLIDALVIDGGTHFSKALLASAAAAKRVFIISDMKRHRGEGDPEEPAATEKLFADAGIKDVVKVMNRYVPDAEDESAYDTLVEEAEEGAPVVDSKRFISSVDRMCDRFS